MPHEEQQHTNNQTHKERAEFALRIVRGVVSAAAKHGEFSAVLRTFSLYLNGLDPEDRIEIEAELKTIFYEESDKILVES